MRVGTSRIVGLLILTCMCLGGCSRLGLPWAAPPDPTAAHVSAATPVVLPDQATISPVVAGESSIGDELAPELGNTGYDVQKYTLELRLDPAADHLDAEVAIEAVSALDGLNRLSLDFIGFDIREVSANGQPVEFEREGDKLWVNLAQPVGTGQPFTVKVAYGGEPELFASRLSPGVPLGLYVDPKTRRAYVLGEPDGARAWFPSNDHPLDPALFEFRVEVPKPLTAVTSGQQTGKEDLGDWIRWIYASDDPMATYLAAMAVGQYEEVAGRTASGVPLRHFVLPGSRAEAERIFADTASAMAFLEEILGPYPFDSYGHVVIDSPEGIALETQTMTTWSQAFVTAIPEEIAQLVLVHELAHQWAGDAIRLESWQDTWLKEGFATYMEVLWGERQGSTGADASLRDYEQLPSGRWSLDSLPSDQLYDRAVYDKGAWVFHMLRQEVGDQAFFATLRRYVERNRGEAVTLADFQSAAEEVSGKDLDDFFEHWVAWPGNPELTVHWIVMENADAKPAVQARICQMQRGAAQRAYEFPLMLRLSGAEADEMAEMLVSVDAPAEDAIFAVDFTPTALVVDPENHLLANVSVSKVETLAPCPAK